MIVINKLNSAGYPLNPNSIFIAIQQKYLPPLEQLRAIEPFSYPEFIFPVRCFGYWENLVGFISEVREFTDGTVVKFPQNLQKSMLKWTDAVLWIPHRGTAGIL